MGMVSNCCTASKWGSGESDICANCKDHAEFYDEDILQVGDLIEGQKYRVIDSTIDKIGTILIYQGEAGDEETGPLYTFDYEDTTNKAVIVFTGTEIPQLEEVRGDRAPFLKSDKNDKNDKILSAFKKSMKPMKKLDMGGGV